MHMQTYVRCKVRGRVCLFIWGLRVLVYIGHKGLIEGYILFGQFNSASQITDQLFLYSIYHLSIKLPIVLVLISHMATGVVDSGILDHLNASCFAILPVAWLLLILHNLNVLRNELLL